MTQDLSTVTLTNRQRLTNRDDTGPVYCDTDQPTEAEMTQDLSTVTLTNRQRRR